MTQRNDSNIDINTDLDAEQSIAIIGMAGRFPDAATLEQFWKNLHDGLDSVHPISDDELRQAGVEEALIADSSYVKVASMLSDIDLFDAEFFGIAAREAELMDPQHRLFLECSWEALEHAGYSPRDYEGSIGVFGGVAESAYLFENIASNPAVIRSMGGRAIMQVNQKDFLCGRVAYELNLRGPALVVQTACSTSLVAVHVACQSILNGECDMALAGGVALSNLQKTGYSFVEGGIQSADGHCRAFDAEATGIVDGSGIGMVVLKRLADAYADGDYIHAVVRGSAINNDGSDKISFTAPSVDRQAAVISEALSIADVTADSIAYVEAHGTGTRLGDPIEVRALSKAFALTSARKQYCALGSVKTNLGHLDTAAGIAGLIKTVLSLQHRQIPPSLHFRAPNPHIDFAASPFYVNSALGPWPDLGAPLRAGVSSFGVGGTNAHVVLEEAPARVKRAPSSRPQLLLLSAKTPAALSAAAANLSSYLDRHPEFSAADVSHTLMSGRQQFEYRRSVVCVDEPGAEGRVRSFDAAHLGRSSGKGQPEVVFMFPGGGTQYVGMGRSLYASEPCFRQQVDRCAALAQPILQLDLRTVLFPEDDQVAAAQALMKQLHVSLVALFTLEYALAKQFMDWGVKPAAMIGHSLGEYVAASLAGVFSLPDALKVVAERGRLIGALPPANMLAVLLSPEQVSPWLGDGLWLACVNARQACTVAGTPEATEALAARWTEAGVEFQFLRGWPASHSGLMAPILASFRSVVASVALKAPTLPFLSNLSGDWITDQQAQDPDYWVGHLGNTVCFAQGVDKLMARQLEVFLEVGPGHTLCGLVKRDQQPGAACSTIDTLPRQDEEASSQVTALAALGRLWTVGCAFDGAAVHRSEPRSRVPLPTYPFQRKRYWIGKGVSAVGVDASGQRSDPVGQGGQGAPLPATEGAPTTVPAHDGAASLALHARPDLSTEFVAPQSATERELCAIWEALLGVGPIGIQDNFFSLGGSSLIAIQLASRIRTRLGAEVPLRTLFRESTVAAQAQEVERMRAPQGEPALGSIPRRAVTDIVPPSYSQQRLLFIHQLDPAADAAYHIPKSIRIHGPLDRARLKAALDMVVRRHEDLRTCFGTLDGQPVQLVGPAETGFALREVDLGGMPAQEQAHAVQHLSDKEERASFSLSQGPLIRGLLLRLSDMEHLWVVTQHHIISDGWSIGIMVREVCTLYEAFSQGQPDPLPPLPIQYADYAVWQRAWLKGEVLDAQIAYWKQQLGGAPALLELPTDRPRPALQSYVGGHRPFEVPPALTEGLRQLSQRHGTTLFMTLLAGWSVLLSRLSGQNDIVVGTPVANRQRKETEGLIGLFVNTLALRVRLDGNPTVEQLLQQVKATTLDAYEHQDLPFEQVVEALQPQRSMSHSPLFQAMLNVHNTPGDSELSVAGLRFLPEDTREETALCDLMLSLHIGSDRITADLNYAKALFDAATIERMQAHLLTVLSGMVVEDDQRRVSQMALLSHEQRHMLLEGFNATRSDYPRDRLMHELFEAQVRAYPERLALVCDDERLSYAQLNARANRLAHALLATGVRPDDRVAICMQRNVALVVAVLAVLKAGGAYVPLDPAYPAERVAYMLSDCEPVAVLTQMLLQHDVRTALPIGVPMLVVDGIDAARIAEHSAHDPGRQSFGLAPSHMAYVIYTSGSTGQPKGVAIEHGNAVNFIHWGREAFSTDELAMTLFSTSINFDLHVFELFVPLSAGTSIRLVPDALTHDDRWNDVTLINTVPSAMQSLLDNDELPDALRCINLAGEPLRGMLVERAFASSRIRRLVNLYGPSETTTYSTFVSMDRSEGFRPGIGRPVANTRVYVLDANGAPAPLGVIGELHIGGDGVARGYFNRDELTRQRFLPDPFSDQPGARMYKTGDLGRWLPDGTLEFLGRNDHQVKIRGFRIELGEIETRLLQCAGVREAVVLAREVQAGDKRLVAYLTMHEGPPVTAAQLRDELAHSLVEYMVPSAFVVLPELPLTPNGKIDRKALPAPDEDALASRTYEAPATDLEQTLAQIWQDLLGVGRVGRHDHFFELGGHSLMAVRLLRRVEDECGVDLPMRDLFERPVLREFAERVQQLQFEVYMGADINALKRELGGLSESELLAILEDDGAAARARVSPQLQ